MFWLLGFAQWLALCAIALPSVVREILVAGMAVSVGLALMREKHARD